jgi:DNA-binding transcriptional regulator YiaG
MSRKQSDTSPSVADQIIEGLRAFTDALEHDEVAKRFRCKTLELQLKPRLYSPSKVRKVRQLVGASQEVFALLLGVTVRAVRSWEVGKQEPSRLASRFMDEIQRNPKYWIGRLQEAAVAK